MRWRAFVRACGAALVSLVVPGFSRAFRLVESEKAGLKTRLYELLED
jgi:hypothetical protein